MPWDLNHGRPFVFIQSDILIGDLMLRMVCMHNRNKNPPLIVSISDNNLNISDEESITRPHFCVQAAGGAVYPLVLDTRSYSHKERTSEHTTNCTLSRTHTSLSQRLENMDLTGIPSPVWRDK